MLLSALLESQLEVFTQQCPINVAHVIANDIDVGSSSFHLGEK